MTDGADTLRVLVVFFDWLAPPCSDKNTAFLTICEINIAITVPVLYYTTLLEESPGNEAKLYMRFHIYIYKKAILK